MKLNSNIISFMYHDVCAEGSTLENNEGAGQYYRVSSAVFRSHVDSIAAASLESVFPEDVDSLASRTKRVVLTFDDGLEGNFHFAAPSLHLAGMKATFYVTPSLIGKPRFMTWRQLEELVRLGFHIHSHGLTHRPLATLPTPELSRELRTSKAMLENKLGVPVTSLSLPHGDYDHRVLAEAAAAGYAVVCTSDAGTVQRDSHGLTCILGRFAMTRRTSVIEFRRILELRPAQILALRAAKSVKKYAKRVIGVQRYRRMYRAWFGIDAAIEGGRADE